MSGAAPCRIINATSIFLATHTCTREETSNIDLLEVWNCLLRCCHRSFHATCIILRRMINTKIANDKGHIQDEQKTRLHDRGVVTWDLACWESSAQASAAGTPQAWGHFVATVVNPCGFCVCFNVTTQKLNMQLGWAHLHRYPDLWRSLQQGSHSPTGPAKPGWANGVWSTTFENSWNTWIRKTNQIIPECVASSVSSGSSSCMQCVKHGKSARIWRRFSTLCNEAPWSPQLPAWEGGCTPNPNRNQICNAYDCTSVAWVMIGSSSSSTASGTIIGHCTSRNQFMSKTEHIYQIESVMYIYNIVDIMPCLIWRLSRKVPITNLASVSVYPKICGYYEVSVHVFLSMSPTPSG